MQVIVEFVFVLVHISDGVFLILIRTFLEKFCVLYNPVSYLSGCQSMIALKLLLLTSDSSCKRVLP